MGSSQYMLLSLYHLGQQKKGIWVLQFAKVWRHFSLTSTILYHHSFRMNWLFIIIKILFGRIQNLFHLCHSMKNLVIVKYWVVVIQGANFIVRSCRPEIILLLTIYVKRYCSRRKKFLCLSVGKVWCTEPGLWNPVELRGLICLHKIVLMIATFHPSYLTLVVISWVFRQDGCHCHSKCCHWWSSSYHRCHRCLCCSEAQRWSSQDCNSRFGSLPTLK